MTTAKLITLAELLAEGVSIGALATAIESAGIWGWDRYGRFTKFKPKDQGATEALDLLAAEASRSQDPDEESPLDESERMGDQRYRQHGWMKEELPDFDGIQATLPDVPRSPPDSRVTRTDLTIIAALLSFIEGEKPFKAHPEYVNETQLIATLSHVFEGYRGMSERTLAERLPEARESLKFR